MRQSVNPSEADLTAACADLRALQTALQRAIVGQEELIGQLITACFAGGHVLLEGLPGMGKTHLIKGLAASLGVILSRVQCTPDLMPADITGSELPVQQEQGARLLGFRRGPIFASMVLMDEINRATPKTQAAMLEAMQEGQVTHAGVSHPLPEPFWVFATQNPIEIEGTYPLPEAQLDRFMFKLDVRYPSQSALLAMLEVSLDEEPAERLPLLLTPQRVSEIMQLARSITVAAALKKAAVELILATQPAARQVPQAAVHFRYGPSPRGLQSLLRAARVKALMAGRPQLSAEDIRSVALPALRHRVLLTLGSELEGVRCDDLLQQVIDWWSAQQ
ncbi:MAG: AAA family ATPase [Gammaproteobacteria bacterium]|nr:AAA family ATPase [Gammaproteobacteria bacterium]